MEEKKSRHQLGVDKFPAKDEEKYRMLKAKYAASRITSEIAREYQKKAVGKSVREQFVLREELIQKYGVTELEATNILCGNPVSDYITKYELMSQGIFFNVYGKGSHREY